MEVLFQATSGTAFGPCQTACVGRPRSVLGGGGRGDKVEGEETTWRERGGGRGVAQGGCVDGLGRSGVGIVGEKGICSLM